MNKGFIAKTSANQFHLENISRTFTNVFDSSLIRLWYVFDTSLIPKNIEYATEDKRVLSRKSLLYISL